jgi:hypothetical protein
MRKVTVRLLVRAFGKLASKAIHVRFLHQKDDISPTDVSFRDGDSSVRLRSGRARTDAGNAVEYPFGRQASKSVLAANEQQLEWVL